MSAEGQGVKDIGEGVMDDDSKAQKQTEQGDDDSKQSKPQWMIDLNRSLARNSKDAHARYIQLATTQLDKDGKVRPACRTVVFRGFMPGTEVRQSYVDRSNG